MRRQLDPVSLVGGVVIAVLGVVLMLDQGGDVELCAGLLGAIFVGAFGLIWLVSGHIDGR